MKKGVGLLQPLHQQFQQFQQQQEQREEQKQHAVVVHRLRCTQGHRTRIPLALTAAMTYVVAVQVTCDLWPVTCDVRPLAYDA